MIIDVGLPVFSEFQKVVLLVGRDRLTGFDCVESATPFGI
jgi:hypothetical protein